jgi:hypothetical protein
MMKSTNTPVRWQERLVALGYLHFEPVKADREKEICAVYFRSIRTPIGRRKALSVTYYRSENGTWMVRIDTHKKIGRSIMECASWLGPFSEADIFTGFFEIELAVLDEWEKACPNSCL